MEEINIDDSYKLTDKYFTQQNILYSHQHDSFNQFVSESIPNFLMSTKHICYEQITTDKKYRNGFIFEDVSIKPPVMEKDELMFPTDARLKNLTYSAKIMVKVTQIQEIEDIMSGIVTTKVIGNPEKNVPIARIPIMVRSKFCNTVLHKEHDKAKLESPTDPGGVFIIRSKSTGFGSEKVIISQEKMKPNKWLIFYRKEQNIKFLTATIHSQNYENISANMQIFSLKMKKDNIIEMNIPQFKPLSVFILLRALGIEKDKDIIDLIVGNDTDKDMINILRGCLSVSPTSSVKVFTTNDAHQFMMNKIKTKIKYSESDIELKYKQKQLHLDKILTQDILPHITGGLHYKALYICYGIRKLLLCKLNRSKIDDRDSFVNKRVELPGPLLMIIFLLNFKKMMGECRRQFDSRGNNDPNNPPNVIVQIKPNLIEQGIRGALSFGTWGNSKTKKGVSQSLPRISYIIATSSLRKIVSPSSDASTNKMTGPRHLHGSQNGPICQTEVPEGPKTGLIKNLTLLASVTHMDMYMIGKIKELLGDKLIRLTNLKSFFSVTKLTKVFLNDEWVGMVLEPVVLLTYLREQRFNGLINKMVSMYFDPLTKELHLFCDGGRLYRLLYVVNDDGKLNYTKAIVKKLDSYKTWNEFMINHPNVVEYIDIEESFYSMLAVTPKDVNDNYKIKHSKKKDGALLNRYSDNKYVEYTHCEIHPSLNLGVIASSIPYYNHNQSPRNIYQYSQSKQAMGLYSTAYRILPDISYVLYHTQVPIVSTRAIKYTGQDICTAGENLIMAFMSYGGGNQEDSIIIKQGAIDRGLLRAKALTKYSDEITSDSSTAQHDVFMIPTAELVSGRKNIKYDKLNVKGYVPEETIVENGDAILGKVTPIVQKTREDKPYKDASTYYKKLVPGVIDKVWDDIKTDEGYDQINMRIRAERIPVMGDKFSSRAGQKGTIGRIMPDEDMPMTADGIIPDIIINPNGIPRRMAIGQIIEMLSGKIAVLEGLEADATPFNDTDMEKLKDKLESLGFNRHGNEKMYNGLTGEEIETEIFIAPCYYQRLKHLVHDKMHSRSQGPKQILTRQPNEGRSREGGLRLGEMERDSLISHGVSMFLKERLVDCSDMYSCHICKTCGLFATRQKNVDKTTVKEVYYCQNCDNNTATAKITIPYAFKLLIQELATLNIAARIHVK